MSLLPVTDDVIGGKAVDDGHPLRGELMVRGVDDEVASQRSSGPEPGEAWVEARLLSLLNIGLGDEADLGVKLIGSLA